MISSPSIADGELRDFFASRPVSPPPNVIFANAGNSQFEAFRQIVEITTRVFGQKPAIQPDHNPDFPEERCLVLTVELPANVALVLEKEAAWTKQVAAVEPKLDMIRLSIKPLK